MGRDGAAKAVLSRREREVAALVADGLTNRAIAERMFISERTVDGHLEHIREKLGFSSRAQVAAWYVAQSGNGLQIVAAPSLPRRRIRPPNLLLAAAAVAVLALVVGVTLFERLTPGPQTGPLVTKFISPNTADQLGSPQSAVVGPDGLVYIADAAGVRIRTVDPKSGSIATFAGNSGAPAGPLVEGGDRLATWIGFVDGVAIASDGLVYYANRFMVGRIVADGTVHFVAGAKTPRESGHPMREPEGLAFAPDGTLYIADRAGNRVWKRAPDGVLTLFAGNGQEGFSGDGGAATNAELDRPRALAVEADGDVLIVDTDNNRIREVVHGSNVINTIAGSGDYYGFSGDGGPATSARLSLPWGVAVGRDGTIYIADAGNDRVRAVTSRGIINTIVHGDLKSPADVAVAPSGDLFVVDLGDPWLRWVHLARGAATP